MLLSINPEHVENILRGTKLFEFRKVRCKPDIDKIIIYSTAPEKMVVGEAEIEEILEDDVETIWGITRDFSGISYKFYMSYYKDKEKAVAYKLRRVKKYKDPKPLSAYGLQYAPQSFVYLKAAI
ncbi:MAG: hypothetical protein VB106_17095 [Clostridiaceae bacterium]|nr:hypothetical protein [Clostridiaceae bacterium]